MLGLLEGSDLLIVAVIVLLLFGGSKLPQLARSLGEAQRELRNAAADHDDPQAPARVEAGTADVGPDGIEREPHASDSTGEPTV
jgi:sec-independent protein translocase protein TatA